MNDLGNIDTVAACDKPAEIELMHPITGEGTGNYILIVGKHSNIFREHVRKNVNASLREQAVATKRGKKAPVVTVEGAEADAIDLLVACTVGFRCDDEEESDGGNFLRFNGKFEFSPDNARKLYTERLWVREQIDGEIDNLENFMKG